MGDNSYILDQEVVEALRRYPTISLIRILFPQRRIPTGARLLRSPFHEDSHPSFSCFTGRSGAALWKDHSTGESGDNISLFRRLNPQLSYAESVDALALMTLGRSAYTVPGTRTHTHTAVSSLPSVTAEQSAPSALQVVSALPLDSPQVPQYLRDYWRGRGISDDVAAAMELRYVIYENSNRKGRPLTDPASGLPILKNGVPMLDSGRYEALGMYNDLGGMVLRVPGTATTRGFKGATSSFISTFLACGGRPQRSVRLEGTSSVVSHIVCDSRRLRVEINPQAAFTGIAEYAMPYFTPLLAEFSGTVLDSRTAERLCAVADALNSPVVSEVAVVEGMFDGLSERELARCRMHTAQGRDLVIANSISNLRWAVPFICRHHTACLMLDNDNSQAGQKAGRGLREAVAAYSSKVGAKTAITDGSALYAGYKDLNEALVASKREKNTTVKHHIH